METSNNREVASAFAKLPFEEQVRVFSLVMMKWMAEKRTLFSYFEMKGAPELPPICMVLGIGDESKARLKAVADKVRDESPSYSEANGSTAGPLEFEKHENPAPAPELKPEWFRYPGKPDLDPETTDACKQLLQHCVETSAAALTKTAYDAKTGKPVGVVMAVYGTEHCASFLAAVAKAVKANDLTAGESSTGIITDRWADTVVLCRVVLGEGWKIQGKLKSTPDDAPTDVLATAPERSMLVNHLKKHGYEVTGAQAGRIGLELTVFERKPTAGE